jgi:ammonia channel protein AmtB
MKVLLLLISLVFIFIGYRFLFQSKKIIQGIQKYRYKMTAEPRKQEVVMARIMGILLIIVGLYYGIISVLALIV